MRAFTEGNGIRHIRVAPYHPASNGLAERAVRTVKEALKKSSEGSLEKRLARFLLTYRVTPHATTGVPPCQLLMGRQLTTAIDRIRPDVAGRVQRNQERQKQEHDSRSRQREFKEDERVFVRDFGGPTKWTPATVAQRTGPVSYTCTLPDQRQVKRHVDHVLGAGQEGGRSGDKSTARQTTTATMQMAELEKAVSEALPVGNYSGEGENSGGADDAQTDDCEGLRRSERQRKQPDRLCYA
jgi:hypothetical protein